MYYKVIADSAHFAGFETTGLLKGEPTPLIESDIGEFMWDYINGSVDESDEEDYENPCEVTIDFIEITEEEYLEDLSMHPEPNKEGLSFTL